MVQSRLRCSPRRRRLPPPRRLLLLVLPEVKLEEPRDGVDVGLGGLAAEAWRVEGAFLGHAREEAEVEEARRLDEQLRAHGRPRRAVRSVSSSIVTASRRSSCVALGSKKSAFA